MNQVLAAGDWSQIDGLGYFAVGVVIMIAVLGVASLFKRKR